MQMTLGVLRVTLKHAFQRGGVIYYQRAIPKDLQDRYPAKLIKLSLETDDVLEAKRKIEQLDREHEAEWSMMRGNPAATPKTVKGQAIELLRKHGLSADAASNDEIAIDLFRDGLEYRVQQQHHELTPVEVKAAQIIAGTVKPTLTEALELYLEVHPKRDTKRFEEHTRLIMKTLTDVAAGIARDTGMEPAEAAQRVEFVKDAYQAQADNYITSNLGIPSGDLQSFYEFCHQPENKGALQTAVQQQVFGNSMGGYGPLVEAYMNNVAPSSKALESRGFETKTGPNGEELVRIQGTWMLTKVAAKIGLI